MSLNLIFDRTESDLINDTDKGYHQPSDLQRLDNAVQYLSDLLNKHGYANEVDLIASYEWNDYSEGNLEKLRQNIKTLMQKFSVKHDTPLLPSDLDYMNIYKANAIEKILFDIDMLIKSMEQSFIYCGEIYAGEV